MSGTDGFGRAAAGAPGDDVPGGEAGAFDHAAADPDDGGDGAVPAAVRRAALRRAARAGRGGTTPAGGLAAQVVRALRPGPDRDGGRVPTGAPGQVRPSPFPRGPGGQGRAPHRPAGRAALVDRVGAPSTVETTDPGMLPGLREAAFGPREWQPPARPVAGGPVTRRGTWTYDLATGMLRRSHALDALYQDADVVPDGPHGALESDQIALLSAALRGSGPATTESRVDLPAPDGRILRFEARAERDPAGTPVRLQGTVTTTAREGFRSDAGARAAAPAPAVPGGAGPAGRFAELIACLPAGVAVVDAHGRVADANAAMAELLDASVAALRGLPVAVLTPDPDRGPNGLPGWLRPVPPGAEHGYRVDALALRRPDGTRAHCDVVVTRWMEASGAAYWLLVCSDAGERLRAAELLATAGTVDELTRLPNRAGVLALVDHLLAAPGADRVALVCGDLDGFARINAALGHETGDGVLVTLAARLQRELPVGCTAARLAADEFVVVCADHGLAHGPDGLARRVAELLRETVPVQGRTVQLTASVGVATPAVAPEDAGPLPEVRAADLLRYAETAMHEAKRAERGGVRVATPADVAHADRSLALEAELRAAIADGGLMLQYQPVVGPDGTIGSVEALVRWPHLERGLIPPQEFLPVAERAGLLRELDLWVLRTAAREAAGWPGRVSVAVNLAGLLPSDPEFVAEVSRAVTDVALPWERLVLELVETSLVALPQHALDAMAELVGRGVRFAVDDFGTGYSSLSRLKELPAQTVKIDRAFVTGVATDPADFAVARAVVDMARAMGRVTVAEGVETAEQFHVLRGLGVDAYQGWLFARPLSGAVLRDVLGAGRLPTPAARER